MGFKDGETVGTTVGAFDGAPVDFLVGTRDVFCDGALDGVVVVARRAEQMVSVVAAK